MPQGVIAGAAARVGTALLLGFFAFGTAAVAAENDRDLKVACIKATVRAIGLEIDHRKMQLEAAKNGPGDPANVPEFTQQIEEMNAEAEKYRNLKPEGYELPETETVTVRVSSPLRDGSMLMQEGMSRSGPFYHLAGVRGGDYAALQPGHTYRLLLYLVRRRAYPFPDHYVYVAGFTDPAQ
jgi:hypothetical protein